MASAIVSFYGSHIAGVSGGVSSLWQVQDRADRIVMLSGTGAGTKGAVCSDDECTLQTPAKRYSGYPGFVIQQNLSRLEVAAVFFADHGEGEKLRMPASVKVSLPFDRTVDHTNAHKLVDLVASLAKGFEKYFVPNTRHNNPPSFDAVCRDLIEERLRQFADLKTMEAKYGQPGERFLEKRQLSSSTYSMVGCTGMSLSPKELDADIVRSAKDHLWRFISDKSNRGMVVLSPEDAQFLLDTRHALRAPSAETPEVAFGKAGTEAVTPQFLQSRICGDMAALVDMARTSGPNAAAARKSLEELAERMAKAGSALRS